DINYAGSWASWIWNFCPKILPQNNLNQKYLKKITIKGDSSKKSPLLFFLLNKTYSTPNKPYSLKKFKKRDKPKK
ncbi:MAG: hypothetical protein ACUVXA_16110, partial [Candidatus Jordarchaeum sp.]|uniref:hypothetical protein n=1 Tax=Candidatus Jordarchaeum sp. TaxID=2823881 RepID=UPI004049732F